MSVLRIHCGVEVTESSTNKQHSLSAPQESTQTEWGQHKPQVSILSIISTALVDPEHPKLSTTLFTFLRPLINGIGSLRQ